MKNLIGILHLIPDKGWEHSKQIPINCTLSVTQPSHSQESILLTDYDTFPNVITLTIQSFHYEIL